MTNQDNWNKHSEVAKKLTFDQCMTREWDGISDKPAFCIAMCRGDLASWNKQAKLVKIEKINEEKRLVLVILAKITESDGKPVIDSDGDYYTANDAEEADIEAFADGGLSKGGYMHKKIGGADVVQHMTFSKEERRALGFGDGPELWVAKLRVNDDELWKKIKNGELPEMSIHGKGEREWVSNDAV